MREDDSELQPERIFHQLLVVEQKEQEGKTKKLSIVGNGLPMKTQGLVRPTSTREYQQTNSGRQLQTDGIRFLP